MGGIVHDKIGNATFDIKFQYLYNMRMAQVSNSASLSQKIVHILISEAHIQHFDGGKGVEMDVFAQINVGEVTTPQQLDNTVISQLLTHARFREIAFFVFHLSILITQLARCVQCGHSRPRQHTYRWATMQLHLPYRNDRDKSRACFPTRPPRYARWYPH